MMYRIICLGITTVLLLTTGCLKVSTPNTTVEIGKLPDFGSSSSDSSQSRAEYADALEDVIEQQNKLLEEMDGGSWSDLHEEAVTWVQQIRTLSGHADASHNPKEFREQCDRLMKASVAVRQAARARDAARTQKALDACDPLINTFCRTFPLTKTVGSHRSVASAASEKSPTQNSVLP